MSRIQLTAEYIVPAHHRDEALSLIAEVSERSRLEPGNLSYSAYQSLEDPTRIALIEIYENYDAVDAHRESSHFREIVLAKLVPLLTSRTVRLSIIDD